MVQWPVSVRKGSSPDKICPPDHTGRDQQGTCQIILLLRLLKQISPFGGLSSFYIGIISVVILVVIDQTSCKGAIGRNARQPPGFPFFYFCLAQTGGNSRQRNHCALVERPDIFLSFYFNGNIFVK